MNDWISVKIALPKYDEKVLVIRKYKTLPEIAIFFNNQIQLMWKNKEEDNCHFSDVLYWMTLPEVP